MAFQWSLMIGVLLIPVTLFGQFTIGPDGPQRPEPGPAEAGTPDGPETFRLTITPAPEPVPALKYRFDVPLLAQKPGNSVPFYYRALHMLDEIHRGVNLQQFNAILEKSQDTPLSKFPVDEAREVLSNYDGIFEELERAHVREKTDWGWQMQELRGTEWLGFLLPEVQDSRELARLLFIKGRVELAERRFDDAERTLRMAYHLAGAISRPPTIIDDLVGVTIARMTNRLVRDWISIKGSPNVYWAIAALPNPLIDVRHSVEYELGLVTRFAPWLTDPESDRASPAVWRDRFIQLMRELIYQSGRSFPIVSIKTQKNIRKDVAGLAVTLIALQHYPAAKASLLERGFSVAEVESMPVGKVLAIQQRFLNRRAADELLKPLLVPVVQSAKTSDRVMANLREEGLYGPQSYELREPFPLMALFGRGSDQPANFLHRLQTRITGLRTVEAIRMHAAETGELPKSLNKIQVVPVPDNPLTDEPFEYSLNGGTAVLDVVVNPRYEKANWRFELKLASPNSK